jgi:hypothetical protein
LQIPTSVPADSLSRFFGKYLSAFVLNFINIFSTCLPAGRSHPTMRVNSNNILISKTTLTIAFPCIFFFFLVVRLWFDFSELEKFRPFQLLLPLTFIFIAFFRTKTTWILAMALFMYGVYYYFFRRIWSAYPGAFEFTLPLNELMYRDKHGYTTGHLFQRYLTLFPLLFYVISIITFLTTPVRKLYWTKPSL